MTRPSIGGVTVIVPWYGEHADEVLRLLRSIDRQDYGGPVEISVCDDGSPPAAAGALRAGIASRPPGRPPVAIHRHATSRGPSAARNTAARHARHDWLLWADADDELEPHALSRMTAAIAPGVGLVTARCWVVDGDRRALRRPDVYLDLARSYRNTPFDPLAQVIFSLHPQMMRRDVFARLGGFDEARRYAEMTELFLRYAAGSPPRSMRAVAEPLYRHYRRRGSLSSNRSRMEAARRAVLLEYGRLRGLPGDDLLFIGRCAYTGARHYAPIVAGVSQLPPYLDVRTDGVYLVGRRTQPTPPRPIGPANRRAQRTGQTPLLSAS